MNVRDLSRALERCYDDIIVHIQVDGKTYDIERVIKQSDVTDRDENDVIILKAVN